MTVHVRPRWMRRIRAAWAVLTAPEAQFDNPLAHIEAQRRRRNVLDELSAINHELLAIPHPVSDDLARFAAVKGGIAGMITEYEHKGLTVPAIVERLKRLTGTLQEPGRGHQ